jgi:outer membrane protein OmpA-like peptidoglycan-associated protein
MSINFRTQKNLAAMCFGLLTACSSTSVTLLPDPEGKVGQVEVITEEGKTVLGKAYENAETPKLVEAPVKTSTLDNQAVRAKYSAVLAKEPVVPDHFLIYFKTGKSGLLPEARTTLVQSKARIEERKSCDFSVIGHTDRVYKDDYNYLLSMVRAQNVAKALADMGVPDRCMDIRYYGESYLVVPTPDESEEPRNRVVVIEIR